MSSYSYPAPGTSYAPPPPGSDPTAVMGRRVGAWIVDSVIVIAPATALASRDFEFVTRDERGRRFGDFDETVDFCDRLVDADRDFACVPVPVVDRAYIADDLPDNGTTGGWGLALGLSVLLLVVVQGLTGWTPGKLLFGLRTVGEDGRHPGIGPALVRWLLFIVDGLCAGLVGFIVALTNKGHRRVGDMAAKTYVVGREHAGSPIVVPGMTPGYAPYPGPPGGPGAPDAGRSQQPSRPGPPAGQAAPPPHAAAPEPEPAPEPAGPAEPEPQSLAGPPSAGPETTAAEATTQATESSGYNPQWDPARGTYIVWSAERGQWLGWDDTAKEWRPL